MKSIYQEVDDCALHGVNSDLPPWTLPPGAFEYGFNYRIADGFIEATGSGNELADLGSVENPGYLQYVNSPNGDSWVVCTDDSVLAYTGSTTADISHIDGYSLSSQADWTGCALANIPVFNHPSSYPQYWSPQNTGVPLEYLPWDATQTWKDVGESCGIMRSHKQFLIAMDLQSGSEQIVDGVRWSTPADIGGIPESWDHLDVTNKAGLTNLSGNGGRIIDGLTLRDAFVIYREQGITVFDYIGGQFIWQIRNLETTTGLISQNSIAEVNERHYFIGDGDIFVNDGNKVTSIMYNRIRKLFQASYNPDTFTNCYVINNKGKKELWFCVPAKAGAFLGNSHFAADATYPNVAFIYNWKENAWGIRQIEEAPFGAYGPSIGGLNGPAWDDSNQTWDSSTDAWDPKRLFPLDDTVITVRLNTTVSLRIEDRLSDVEEDNSPYSVMLKRANLKFGGAHNNTTLQSIYPAMEITYGAGDIPVGPVSWELGSHDIQIKNLGLYPAGASSIRLKSPAEGFNPESQRKIDRRTTGEYHYQTITLDMHTPVDTYAGVQTFKMSGYTYQFVEAGLR